MSDSRPVPPGPDSQRYLFVGDVHLLLVNPTGEVLFGRYVDADHPGGAWALPSGPLKAGESAATALARKARETIGVVVDERDVEFAHVMHSSLDGGRVAFFFVVRNWMGEPDNREPPRCRQLEWFPLGALPYDVIACCRTALEWIATSHCFSLYGW